MKMIELSAEDLLKKYFENFNSCIVALSGGADSATVANLVCGYLDRDHIYSATCVDKHIFKDEIENARQIADLLGIKWIPFHAAIPGEFYNNEDVNKRCYICKKGLFTALNRIKVIMGIDIIFDGTNVDDLKEKRPGFLALKEINVKSPLLDNNLGKDFVYKRIRVFEEKGIVFRDESCIATRIMEGKITVEKMALVERLEGSLRGIYHGIRIKIYNNYIKVFFKNSYLLTDKDKLMIRNTMQKYVQGTPVIFS